jgi:hypothetical protein
MCSCAAGISKCGSNSCADLMNDPGNCGACAQRCLGGSVACEGGICQETSCDGGPCCAAGFTTCPVAGSPMVSCVDLQTNVMNCGSCGNSCATMCIGGTCM